MFRKLRMRLALVNLSVIAALFLILTTGTYFFVQDRMARDSEHLFNMIADDLLSGRIQDWPPGPGPRSEPGPGPGPGLRPGPGPVFFVKTNMIGNVVQISSYAPLPHEAIFLLADQARHSEQCHGSIFYHEREYSYRVVSISANQGQYIIFQDFQHSRDLLQLLVMGLSITGLICTILSLFGSFFMANKAMIPIQKAWQQQNDFLADASHELRTPLSVIQTNLELVQDNKGQTVASQERWLNNIHEEIMSMTNLVTSLLFLARTDAKQILLNQEQFLLDQAIAAAVGPFQPVAAAHGIQLDVEIKKHSTYYGDQAKLRQVVAILLDNAIHYTPPGGSIMVKLVGDNHKIVLSVADTGEGISKEHIQHIFRRFYQSDASRARGGSGLGLSIAKWIVESHHGTITAESKLGKGSTFTVYLPYQA